MSLGFGLSSLALPGCKAKGPAKKATSPNILFIMSDDHASHAMSCYGSRINTTPHIDRIAREGMRFDNCFCTNSICAPSRAVILTGKYSHLNGVRDNVARFDGTQLTFPKLLQEAGYRTVMVGKWHLKSVPTGFDYWTILPGQGDYYNPEMIEMGVRTQHAGYVTDLITDQALNFLKDRRDEARPIFMMLHHKAPHRRWQPALRHLSLYDDADFPEPETMFDDYATRSVAAREQEMTIAEHMSLDGDLKMGPPPTRMTDEQKAAWEVGYGPKRAALEKAKPEGRDLVKWKFRRYMQDYLGCIVGVDENVGRMLDFLEESGLARNTVVLYTSDQGFYLGDHGWFDKRFMYEESLRMPLVVRFPGHIPAASVNNDFVLNLDFAPTILELAGVPVPQDMQGQSFYRILGGREIEGWRESIYYHYYEYPAVHMVKRHYGVRTKRYKLIHFYHDIDAWELYDLQQDPHEVNNVYSSPAYSDELRRLRAELVRLQRHFGDSEELTLKFLKEDLERTKTRSP